MLQFEGLWGLVCSEGFAFGHDGELVESVEKGGQ